MSDRINWWLIVLLCGLAMCQSTTGATASTEKKTSLISETPHSATTPTTATTASTTTTATTTTATSTTTTATITTATSTTTTATTTTATTTTATTTTTTATTTTTLTTTTEPTTARPQLDVPCIDQSQCKIDSSECRNGTCMCTEDTFPFTDAYCLPVSTLRPRNLAVKSDSPQALDITWKMSIFANDRSISENYTVSCVQQVGRTISIPTDKVNTSCTGLLPGNLYTVIVSGQYKQFESSVNTTEYTKPAIPGNLSISASDVTAPNVTLVWGPSDGMVDYYEVTIMIPIKGISKVVNDTSVHVADLDHYVLYPVQIRAYRGRYKSDSLTTEFRTASFYPEPPHSLTTSFVNVTSLVITWQPPVKPNGGPVTYEVDLKWRVYADLPWISLDSFDNSEQQWSRTDLTPGAIYKIVVYSNNTDFRSNTPAFDTIRTRPTVPGNVSSFHVTPGNDSLFVKWRRPDSPNGNIVGYTVIVTAAETSQDNCIHNFTINTTTPSHNETNNSTLESIVCSNTTENITKNQKDVETKFNFLQPNTNYTITITAATKKGDGPASVLHVLTAIAEPGDVSNVQADNVQETSVNVTWTIPEKNPGSIDYRVKVFDEVFHRITNITCTTEDVHVNEEYEKGYCTVEGLEEFWVYSFSVMAYNVMADSSWVSSGNVTTQQGTPGKVEMATYSLYNGSRTCDATKVNVTWLEPSVINRNGLISSYMIKYTDGRPSLQNQTVKAVDIQTTLYSVQQRSYSVILPGLAVEHDQEITILAKLKTDVHGDEETVNFTTGVCAPPQWSGPGDLVTMPNTEVKDLSYSGVVVSSGFFENSKQGKIRRFGLVISTNKETLLWKDVKKSSWAKSKKDHGFSKPYIVPFTRIPPTDNVYKIGGNPCIGIEDSCINGPLKASFSFYVSAYACTREDLCTVTTAYGPFSTADLPAEESSSIAGIVVAVVIIVLAAVAITVFLLWYNGVIDLNKCKRVEEDGESLDPLVIIPTKRPIKIALLGATMIDLHRDSNLNLSSQYQDIQKLSPQYPQEASTEGRNKPKNRWVNILPFDHSRVKLSRLDEDDVTTDYINANYIPGFSTQREYIASQGPLPGTIDDFWRMVWELNVEVIVMLTQCKEGSKVKCEVYWPPNLHEASQYGDVIVDPISMSSLGKYNVVIFNVTVNDVTRQIHHFHYLDFPDFSANVDFSIFIDFVELIRQHSPREMAGPMLIHCSAGVGRTGTFIAVDRLYQFLHSPNFSDKASVDIFDIVMSMRENRVLMVQTESQYVMIHDCLMILMERKKKAEQQEDEEENMYANQGFDSAPEKSLYENVVIFRESQI